MVQRGPACTTARPTRLAELVTPNLIMKFESQHKLPRLGNGQEEEERALREVSSVLFDATNNRLDTSRSTLLPLSSRMYQVDSGEHEGAVDTLHAHERIGWVMSVPSTEKEDGLFISTPARRQGGTGDRCAGGGGAIT